jgi:hypothetical protein
LWVTVSVGAMLLLFSVMMLAAIRQREKHRPAVSAVKAAMAEAERAAVRSDEPAEDVIRQQIESCSFFQEDLTLTLPKSVSPGLMRLSAESYPGLVLAANMGLVAFDPPFDASNAARYLPDPTRPGQASVVTLTGASAGLPIYDSGDVYRMDLGRRRIETITNLHRSGNQLTAVYRWTVEPEALINFAPESQFRQGGATFVLSGGEWSMKSVWINTYSAARILCQNE